MPAEIGQLYGRAGAVELTKEFLSRPHRDGAARSRRQPVLVFTGPHGSGKTALLDKLEEWLQPLAPYAWIDCATDDLSSSPRVLSALVFELNRTAGRYGRLAFPRFITGQLVLRQELVTDDRVRACDQVRQALAEYRNIAA
jgi:ATP/maltotriose-dependent transcriptional regulator MalT